MEYIAHRVNSIEELMRLPRDYGVEVDLRPYGDRLVLQHDPFKDGEDFEQYLQQYKHSLMILNIKSESIEYRILELLQEYEISNYFFYDSSFSMIYALSQDGIENLALGFSEFDGLKAMKAFRDKVKWLWVHCFTKIPFTEDTYREVKTLGYKLCLASPDLYGRNADVLPYIKEIQRRGLVFDAVCTKAYNIDKWKEV